jgi:hypothetical protein
MTKNVDVPVADEAEVVVPEWVAIVEAGLAKAEKYWTASEAQVALRDATLEEMGFELKLSKSYTPAWDVDRLYGNSVGADNLDPQVRELALRLTEGGCKAHATAFLLSIPPRFVGGMLSAAKAARAKAVPVAAEAVAS